MAESQDLIDFNVIESHKENIQALPSGRSAKALAQLYSPPLGAQPSPALTNDANAAARAVYERELANIDEADDPLDVYDRYIKWTLDTYPSAQATPQSQLLPLLERATKAFQSSAHYKNDPRYLKIWLHYIRFFADAPREVFVFLARHGIGDSLALYFEEFAAWLEHAGRWNQAEEIYKLGLEKEARPVERLLRKFGEFEQRKAARPEDAAEPSSPALPAARPALAMKLDPFAAGSPAAAAQQTAGAATKKSKSSKMAIFSDGGDAPSRPDSGSSSKGWDSIGTLADRKKENSMEAKPWAGETLKTGKTNGGMQKMMIFKDQSSSSSSSSARPRHQSSSVVPKHFNASRRSSSTHAQQCVRNPKTGRLECVFVNLEAVYPAVGDLSVEYCFEELRARHRGLLDRNGKRNPKVSRVVAKMEVVKDETLAISLNDLKPPAPVAAAKTVVEEAAKPKPKERGFKIFEDTALEPPASKAKASGGGGGGGDNVQIETSMQTLALNDENDENMVPVKDAAPPTTTKKAKRDDRGDRGNRTRKIKVMDVKHIKNETRTIQINLDSPTGPKTGVKRKKSVVAEPTMTINTKEAMDEIYGIFNQPLQSQAEQTDGEDEDEESSDEDEDDYTTDGESTATGKLSAPASEYGDETRNEILQGQKTGESDRTDNTGWSDFTMSKHVPKESGSDDDVESAPTGYDEREDVTGDLPDGDDDDENPRTLYNPLEPEVYENQVAQLPNHRLPFMTPIVEQTESSLGAGTIRTDKNAYFTAKTPSRKNGIADLLNDDEDDEDDAEPPSSPFDDVLADRDDDDDADKKRILQPIRTKSTKGTLSLGQGAAKIQTASKAAALSLDEPAQKGPIIKDEQCNPMDPALRQTILAEMRPPLSSFDGYYEHLDATSGRSAEIKKFVARTQAKGKAGSSAAAAEKTGSVAVPPTLEFPGAHGKYALKRELGEGAFAPVYLVENSTAAALDAQEQAADQENAPVVSARLGKAAHRRALEAIKMEEPPSTWEFYMIRQTHRRLGVHRATQSLVRAHEMHLYRDECFLVEEFRDQGTLLDLVNLSRAEGTGGGMDETLAMFFTVELLRTVEALHAKQLIHGDLKADNILVRLDAPDAAETDWNASFCPSGAHGWAAKGVCLIDFGRGIDMRHFSPTVGFIADWKTSEADCAEMRELRPWTYQIDYHGLAGCVHSLLFGKYMETVADKGAGAPTLGAAAAKTYRIRESLKRYWQTELWGELFHLLLNPLAHTAEEEGRKMPLVKGLRAARERMESWLEENCERGVGLKGTILRMEAALRERRRKGAKA